MFVKIIRAEPHRGKRERRRQVDRERKQVPFTGAGGERGVVNV